MMKCILGVVALLDAVLAAALPTSQEPITLHEPTPNLPLVVWHGLGDTYDSDGMAYVAEVLNKTIGPTYTYFVRQDDDASGDRTATFLGNITVQVDKACDDIAADPVLSQAPAINAIGMSQGGQFIRAYVERCNNPPVANLVTFGSQHNGISEFQECTNWLCTIWEGFLKSNTWTDFSQYTLIPAQYFRDPEDLDPYLEHSNFLADINNERKEKNATYVENMKKLDKFVMYMFDEDTTVVPKESAFFYDVIPSTEKVVKLQDRDIYKEDWLGLKWLDERGRLDFRVAKGPHMAVGEELLTDVFKTYFAGKNSHGPSVETERAWRLWCGPKCGNYPALV